MFPILTDLRALFLVRPRPAICRHPPHISCSGASEKRAVRGSIKELRGTVTVGTGRTVLVWVALCSLLSPSLASTHPRLLAGTYELHPPKRKRTRRHPRPLSHGQDDTRRRSSGWLATIWTSRRMLLIILPTRSQSSNLGPFTIYQDTGTQNLRIARKTSTSISKRPVQNGVHRLLVWSVSGICLTTPAVWMYLSRPNPTLQPFSPRRAFAGRF